MCRSGATYWPSELLGRVLSTPVSLLVMVTVALGTAAPDGSVTVPTMVASCARPYAANIRVKIARRISRRLNLEREARELLAHTREREFIASLQTSFVT